MSYPDPCGLAGIGSASSPTKRGRTSSPHKSNSWLEAGECLQNLSWPEETPKISEHEALCWQHSGPFAFLPLWREPQLYAGLTSGQVVYFSDPRRLCPPDRITNILQQGFETIRDCCKEVKWTSLGLNPGSALQFPHPKQGNPDPHPQITNAPNNAGPVMSTFWRFTGFSGGL